jgi:hypothetical protein
MGDVVQDYVAFVLIGAAAGYLAWRYLRRRGSGNCCGEAECPAAKNVLRNLNR